MTASKDTHISRIHQLCKYIEEHSGQSLPLKQLARQANFSPYYLQRIFKAIVGVSPKQYLEACRLKVLKQGLKKNRSVSKAIYDAGFGSASRVYERVDNRLGMTPGAYQSGGKNMNISYGITPTILGLMIIAATDRGLCFVAFGNNKNELVKELQLEYSAASIEAMKETGYPQFNLWINALSDHLSGMKQRLDLPIDITGTAFQFQVWKYLQSIPYGQVQSYAEVARGINRPKAIRAVASACAANRVSILIPCHRVIRSDGQLGGYRWGLARKKKLIDRERT